MDFKEKKYKEKTNMWSNCKEREGEGASEAHGLGDEQTKAAAAKQHRQQNPRHLLLLHRAPAARRRNRRRAFHTLALRRLGDLPAHALHYLCAACIRLPLLHLSPSLPDRSIFALGLQVFLRRPRQRAHHARRILHHHMQLLQLLPRALPRLGCRPHLCPLRHRRLQRLLPQDKLQTVQRLRRLRHRALVPERIRLLCLCWRHAAQRRNPRAPGCVVGGQHAGEPPALAAWCEAGQGKGCASKLRHY
ncbi:hypothetical protein DL89DRAFT_101801 [Linderina pennispora]|uniref:Uncharacterized protein n=1 Tax=Linderina pennispora TaxID=61395 RepID=A0A1Y1WF01_9FUNG|nr:uncharacterized protein DL89DRAFT_101801 [Linderina pennispora]ORX71816.1 hypothetical protein DL89DRAFT_101801 [Linderina pennispora]